ncbi:MAG: radical SAM family heme chaperone HemW [Lachnospiraceae bacterium]|nr:radical SAM family heme chaperone HemW [Lachnospiraceae bacterium]
MKNKTQEIYVHIPFCARKCDYCDFVSFVTDDDTKKAYFSMLEKQIDMKAESAGSLPVDSVFFGGGTPSLVDAGYIADVMEHLRRRFLFTDDAEITIEMNPNSAHKDKLSVYRSAGINRLSIGLQSTVDEELKRLSRLHSYEEFLRSYDLARTVGFSNINIDIMSALPGQSSDSYTETLKKVCKLAPEHISAYSLIIEEGTPFYERYKDGNGLPGEDLDREMYHDTKRFLLTKGYERYEISNYSKPGFECRHNVGYWTRKPYIGFGIAAASLIDEVRYSMHGDLKRFLSGDLTEEIEHLEMKDRMAEFMFLGLRLIKGVSKKEFFDEFGVSMEKVYKKQLLRLSEEGLLADGERVFLTEKGLDLANVCMAEFLPD